MSVHFPSWFSNPFGCFKLLLSDTPEKTLPLQEMQRSYEGLWLQLVKSHLFKWSFNPTTTSTCLPWCSTWKKETLPLLSAAHHPVSPRSTSSLYQTWAAGPDSCSPSCAATGPGCFSCLLLTCSGSKCGFWCITDENINEWKGSANFYTAACWEHHLWLQLTSADVSCSEHQQSWASFCLQCNAIIPCVAPLLLENDLSPLRSQGSVLCLISCSWTAGQWKCIFLCSVDKISILRDNCSL